MKFSKPETIKKAVKISRYLIDRGISVHGNRTVASWRGGERMSVSFDDAKGVWHDHVSDEGGDVIKLCMLVEGVGFAEAMRTLATRYNIAQDMPEAKPRKHTRGDMLVRDGFKLIKTYTYQNADGTPRYFVDRYEKLDDSGKKVKEFVQRGPNSGNIQGIEKTIYNLPRVIDAEGLVFVSEGEKDADTLTSLGLVATTNSGGAKFWSASFNAHFAGKDVVVIADNDDVGKKHAETIASNIAPVAKRVRTLTISKLPKGDVTDWLELEGGTRDALLESVERATDHAAIPPEIAAAKLANQEPLTNYTLEYREDASGHTKEVRIPRLLEDICDDVTMRFCGYPKRIGSALFDFMKPNKRNPGNRKRRIISLLDADDLRSWIDGTSMHQSDFKTGGPFVSYKSLKARLMQTVQCFDVIANAPWYPERDDAFCAFDALPTADPSHASLSRLMEFFLPATDADRTLMMAFFMAPMFFTRSARPAWIIDTVDAQASGKTAVVKACSWIYNEQPITLDLATFNGDITAIRKRILSTDGRSKRIALFDNVTSSLKSGNLADMITSESISGMAPYGRGEETRTNDITWCATVNGASVDSDMASRSYVIHIKSPGERRDPMWETKLRDFIDEHRGQLQADIMHAIANAKPRMRMGSRFGVFDGAVLSSACATDEDFEAASRAIGAAAEAANDDADLAAQCVEAIATAINQYDANECTIDGQMPCVIKCSDVDAILRRTNGGVRNWTSKVVRRFVNSGHIRNIMKGVERIETADGHKHFARSRCFIFAGNEAVLFNATTAQFVTFNGAQSSLLGTGKIR